MLFHLKNFALFGLEGGRSISGLAVSCFVLLEFASSRCSERDDIATKMARFDETGDIEVSKK